MNIDEYTSYNEEKINNFLLIILSIFMCQVSAIMLAVRLFSGKVIHKRIPGLWILIFFILWLAYTGFFVFGITDDYTQAKKVSDNPVEYMLKHQKDIKLTGILVFYFLCFFPTGINCLLALLYNKRYNRYDSESKVFSTLINDILKNITDGEQNLDHLVRLSAVKKQVITDIVQYLINKGRLKGYYFDSIKKELIKEREGEQREQISWTCSKCGANNSELIYTGEKPGCKYCGNYETL